MCIRDSRNAGAADQIRWIVTSRFPESLDSVLLSYGLACLGHRRHDVWVEHPAEDDYALLQHNFKPARTLRWMQLNLLGLSGNRC